MVFVGSSLMANWLVARKMIECEAGRKELLVTATAANEVGLGSANLPYGVRLARHAI